MTTNDIITACAEAWAVTPEQVLGKCRERDMAEARHYARYLMRTRLEMTLPRIARVFRCTHGTVCHSIEVAMEYTVNRYGNTREYNNAKEAERRLA